MNKKELDEYCLSLGLVQTNLDDLWYGYIYPFKYSYPEDLLVGFQVYPKEYKGQKELNETVQRTINLAHNIFIIGNKCKYIACIGFSDVEDSDEEIKKKNI